MKDIHVWCISVEDMINSAEIDWNTYLSSVTTFNSHDTSRILFYVHVKDQALAAGSILLQKAMIKHCWGEFVINSKDLMISRTTEVIVASNIIYPIHCVKLQQPGGLPGTGIKCRAG